MSAFLLNHKIPSVFSSTMKRSFFRSSALLAGLLVWVSACNDRHDVGEKLLKPVHEGMPKDSLSLIMGKGPLTALYADTLRVENGFRRSVYFIDGAMFEVLYYREEAGDVSEPVLLDVETPIVVVDNKVLGWGWDYYMEAAQQYKLPTPPPARPDSAGAPRS
jgi:hypothetical protein